MGVAALRERTTEELKLGAASALELAPELAGIRMTPEEFDASIEPEDGHRYELIHGVLVVSPQPQEAERDPNGELEYLLRAYKESHPNGKALDKTLSEQTIYVPNRRRADRVIWAGLGRRPNPRVDPPSIVAEFVSAGRRAWMRDYVEKREEYQAAGVGEYWIIDRFERRMTVYFQRDGQKGEIVVKEGETYETPLLPGFVLPLSRLLNLADDWKEEDETNA